MRSVSSLCRRRCFTFGDFFCSIVRVCALCVCVCLRTLHRNCSVRLRYETLFAIDRADATRPMDANVTANLVRDCRGSCCLSNITKFSLFFLVVVDAARCGASCPMVLFVLCLVCCVGLKGAIKRSLKARRRNEISR